MPERGTTRNSRLIRATPEVLYRAFTDPEALPKWLPPGEMTGQIHDFDGQVGGGYRMSLFYPSAEGSRGKTNAAEDRFNARFVELSPGKRIVEAVNFESENASFKGEMIMEVDFEPEAGGTRVTITFKDIPPGVRPEDNEKGTEMTLGQLAHYVE